MLNVFFNHPNSRYNKGKHEIQIGVLYFFLYMSINIILNRLITSGTRVSIPGQVIPKTQKIVLDISLLNTQYYKVHIKGEVEQSKERSSVFPYTSILSLLKKRSLQLQSPTLLFLLFSKKCPKYNFSVVSHNLKKLMKKFSSLLFVIAQLVRFVQYANCISDWVSW